ncbi:hypothetical protein JW964_28190 [candidate division KSB1 bacterium]|nr:hypothetical protein [candidate division KSB1 bacterium]
MIKAVIWILVGIVIIIYNHSGGDSRLVIRWTNLDLGYLVIAYGLFILIRDRIQKHREKKEIEPESVDEN